MYLASAASTLKRGISKTCVHVGLSYVLTLRKATMLIAFSGDSLEKLEERKIRLDRHMNI